MALTDQPYLPLFVDDWMNNLKLRQCSLAAHGLMINIMAIMHKSNDGYGKILLKQKYRVCQSKIEGFASQFARHFPWSATELAQTLTEILSEEVLSIEGDYLICHRMVRDAEISEIRSVSGKTGGKKTQEIFHKFAKAKVQANTGIGIEDENGNEIEKKKIGGLGERIKGFDQFWAVYPKKRSKGDAFKAWTQLDPDEQLTAKILQAVERATKTDDWLKNGGEFIPYPATWLRAEGWEDEYAVPESEDALSRWAERKKREQNAAG